MEAILELLIQHGYWILFAWVLLDQLALPVPALPMLLAAGALAGQGHLNILLCLLIVVFACTPPNLLWYQLGLRQGNKVLTLLCMISLEPDSCISNTTSVFHRYGTASLLVSKFVPGLQTIAPPLAGLLGIGFWRFVAVNGLGSLLYGLVFLLLGYWAHGLIARIADVVAEYGTFSALVIGLMVLSWLVWKIAHRVLFLRSLRGSRVEPVELQSRLEAGEPIQVADLRQRLEFNAYPHTIPGAVRVPLDIFDEEVEKLAKDRLLVLVCT